MNADTKTCTKCGEIKLLCAFCKDRSKKEGLKLACKACNAVAKKARYAADPEQASATSRAWYLANREKVKAAKKARYAADPEKHCAAARAWQTANPEKRCAAARAWQAANRARANAMRKIWLASSPTAKLANALRNRLFYAIKGGFKAGRTADLLGCSFEELVRHLETQFSPGMTWPNHGFWHVDHVRPLSSFDLTDPEQQRQACHYTNLQPLWAADNIRKGAKYEQPRDSDTCIGA